MVFNCVRLYIDSAGEDYLLTYDRNHRFSKAPSSRGDLSMAPELGFDAHASNRLCRVRIYASGDRLLGMSAD